MKSLKVKNILDKGAEESMSNDIKRNKDIRGIEEALEEKRIRETQNLDLRLKKDKLCAEMRKIDEIIIKRIKTDKISKFQHFNKIPDGWK